MNLLCRNIFLLLFSGQLISGEEVSWFRIMTDLGSSACGWVICSSPGSTLRKRLSCEQNPSEFRKVAVEYEIAEDPYDPVQKIRVKGENQNKNYPWIHFQIRVNGVLVLDEPAGGYIYKGIHQVEIPLTVLRTGENSFELGWGGACPGLVRGYIYFATDLTLAEKQRRVVPAKKRPPPDSKSIRVRLLLQI